MPQNRPRVDVTLAKGVPSPSQAFRQFVDDYFVNEYRYRLEQDDSVLQRLSGAEREAAIDLVCANLRTGETQIIAAAAKLGAVRAIPTLTAMQAENIYDDSEQFTISRTLFLLGSIGRDEFLERSKNTLRAAADITSFTVLAFVNDDFPPDEAQQIIDIGLRRDEHFTRTLAYKAAVYTQYIRGRGEPFTDKLREEIWKKESACYTIGSQHPFYSEQLEYYVGDETFKEKALFEARLAELWSMDPAARRVPLFTEIN